MGAQDSSSPRSIRPRVRRSQTRRDITTLLTVPDLRQPEEPPIVEEEEVELATVTTKSAPESDGSLWSDVRGLLEKHGVTTEWQRRLATIGTIAAAVIACTFVARAMRPDVTLPDKLPTIADAKLPGSEGSDEALKAVAPQFDPATAFAGSQVPTLAETAPSVEEVQVPAPRAPTTLASANRLPPAVDSSDPFEALDGFRPAPMPNSGQRVPMLNAPSVNERQPLPSTMPEATGRNDTFGASVPTNGGRENPFATPVAMMPEPNSGQQEFLTNEPAPFGQALQTGGVSTASPTYEQMQAPSGGFVAQTSGLQSTDPERFPTLQEIEESLMAQKRAQQSRGIGRAANARPLGVPARGNISNRGGVLR